MTPLSHTLCTLSRDTSIPLPRPYSVFMSPLPTRCIFFCNPQISRIEVMDPSIRQQAIRDLNASAPVQALIAKRAEGFSEDLRGVTVEGQGDAAASNGPQSTVPPAASRRKTQVRAPTTYATVRHMQAHERETAGRVVDRNGNSTVLHGVPQTLYSTRPTGGLYSDGARTLDKAEAATLFNRPASQHATRKPESTQSVAQSSPSHPPTAANGQVHRASDKDPNPSRRSSAERSDARLLADVDDTSLDSDSTRRSSAATATQDKEGVSGLIRQLSNSALKTTGSGGGASPNAYREVREHSSSGSSPRTASTPPSDRASFTVTDPHVPEGVEPQEAGQGGQSHQTSARRASHETAVTAAEVQPGASTARGSR